ncbi:MAG: hypothetical protein LBB84_02980 [Tannerellaceae bacterium]|jgi:hypothetical protein|nr:hypothetical protein [Tannerellaceae bacterium]
MKNVFLIFLLCGLTGATVSVWAQSSRLQIGGYGEAVTQRMFYSDNVERYRYPESNKEATHGRFDLPHVVFYLSYDFGHGWKISTEVEFEHGGAGSTVEIENEETGEYETEVEKGGEVALEQFWIEKSFTNALNLRLGHVIVPIGLTNQYHMPTEFFSVLRPEEEAAILPCTWHETGISLWGRIPAWRYEAQFIAGLDAERFGNANWIQGGSASPYEFTIANKYAGAFRVDNYSVPGLRIGLSGYFGFSAKNSLKADRYVYTYVDDNGVTQRENINGSVSIGALDAVYNHHHILARTNVLYGHLGDSYTISRVNSKLPSASPSPRTNVASDVLSWYVEAGYDVMAFFPERKYKADKLYLYGHYGYYDSMYKTAKGITAKEWCEKRIVSVGLNYFPLPQVVVKAEYALRKFKAPFNQEPTLSLGIAYSGLFL